MEDKKVLEDARNGNSDAQTEIIKNFQRMLLKASSMYFKNDEKKEALSAGYETLFYAMKNFDAERNIPFAGYAQKKVIGKMYTFYKKKVRQKNREPIADEIFFDHQTDQTAEFSFDEVENQLLVNQILSCLNSNERKLYAYLYEIDLTEKEAAAKMNVSQQTISYRKKKLQQKLYQAWKKLNLF